MRKLSVSTQRELESDPRMKLCALAPYIPHVCSAKIDWHHNLIYAGRQSDMPNTIIGICSEIHDKAFDREVKDRLDWIMLNLMTERDFSLIPNANLYTRKGALKRKYGNYPY